MALTHAVSGEIVRLESLETKYSQALVKTDQFEAIHLVVAAGASLPPHQVAGQLTLHCLTGCVKLTLADGQSKNLAAGDWLYLEGAAEHGVEGMEDSTLLLTILF